MHPHFSGAARHKDQNTHLSLTGPKPKVRFATLGFDVERRWRSDQLGLTPSSGEWAGCFQTFPNQKDQPGGTQCLLWLRHTGSRTSATPLHFHYSP